MNFIKKAMLFIIVSAMTIFIPSCKNCVDYTMTYEEVEPYTDIVNEPIELSYYVSESKYNRIWGDHENKYPVVESWTDIKNTSSHAGTFSITKTIVTDRPRKIQFQDSRYMQPGESYRFYFTQYLEHYELINSSNYDIYPPTVNVQKEV